MDPPNFVDEVPDDLLCLVCMHAVGVGGPAVVTVSCGHLFCKSCLETWLQAGNATCPADRHPLSKDDVRPDVRSQRRADALLVHCSGATIAADRYDAAPPCGWKGAWSDLSAHEARCPAVAPRANCVLRPLGCSAASFGLCTDVAGVASRTAVHNAESSDQHLRILATAVVADRTRTDEMRTVLEALSRQVTRLEQRAADAEAAAKDAEVASEQRWEALARHDMRQLFDTQAMGVASSTSSPAPACVTSVLAATSGEVDTVSFDFDLAEREPDSPISPGGASAATGLLGTVAGRLFARVPSGDSGTGGRVARRRDPGWAALVATGPGRRAAAGSFEFAVHVKGLAGVEDGMAAAGIMVGATTNRGAPLHHGRQGHLGHIPGTAGLQGSGFFWSHGAEGPVSAACAADGNAAQMVTFGADSVVTVRVIAAMDRSAFTGIAFRVGGVWSSVHAASTLGAGPVLPVVAVLTPDLGFRLVPPP